jgi:hypothetical protein
MKLRMKGNSLRLRISRSELAHFVAGHRIEETVRLTPEPEGKLTYALESAPGAAASVRYAAQEITVIVTDEQVRTWSGEDQVGIYTTIDIGPAGTLEVIVEKDFACLDRSDEDNKDTFANPHLASVC